MFCNKLRKFNLNLNLNFNHIGICYIISNRLLYNRFKKYKKYRVYYKK